jgi:uncharacterized membrane protein YbhN (UPF0104 family)
MLGALSFWIVAAAFGLSVNYAAMLLVVGVVNLAGLIPASPGQLGVFEFFTVTALKLVGVNETEAVAYALVVHVIVWLPVTLLGFFYLARRGLGWKAIAQAESIEREAAS